MRFISFPITSLLLVLLYTVTSSAWSLPSSSLRKRIPRPPLNTLLHLHPKRSIQEFERIKEWLQNQQEVMGAAIPNAALPPQNDDAAQGSSRDPIVADVLPKTRGINIFASLTRQFESVESLLNDPSKNVTVIAPRNSAIQDLPRKPWENPADYAKFGEMAAYEGDEGRDRAKRNLQRFVSAHIIPESPWKEGEEVETIGGDKLRWERDGDKVRIEPGGVVVDSIAEQVANGEVWILNGVINYR